MQLIGRECGSNRYTPSSPFEESYNKHKDVSKVKRSWKITVPQGIVQHIFTLHKGEVCS